MHVYVCTSSSGLYTVLMEEKELKWFAILPQWNLLVTNPLRTKKDLLVSNMSIIHNGNIYRKSRLIHVS